MNKTAAIWARVSTDSQKELSLPGQVGRCSKKLVEAEYTVRHTLQTSWSSTDLARCPEYLNLLSLIDRKEIEAVAVYDRDRLSADSMERLSFLAQCHEKNVQVLIVEGPALISEDEGMLVEMALAIGKKRAVLRARSGSKAGLSDRVKIKGLPVTWRGLYGYDWDKANVALLPNDQYPNVKMIFDMVLSGSSYDAVIKQLQNRGIATPTGLTKWNKTTINRLLRNPVYAGRFYALKGLAIEPKVKKSKRVNSSKRMLPLEESYYLPNVRIDVHPIEWEQRNQIFTQLEQHQKLSSRHAKRDYLLRGLIRCSEHRGQNEEPRRYHGRPNSKGHRAEFSYSCPESGCFHHDIPGPELDRYVKSKVAMLLSTQEDAFYEVAMANHRSNIEIERDIQQVRREKDAVIAKQARLLSERLNEEYPVEVYEQVRLKLQYQMDGCNNRIDSLLAEIAQLDRVNDAISSLNALRFKYINKCMGLDGGLDASQWHEILGALNLSIAVNTRTEREAAIKEYAAGFREVAPDVERRLGENVRFDERFDVTIHVGIQLPEVGTKINSIVLPVPGGASHNNTYHLNLSLLNNITKPLAL